MNATNITDSEIETYLLGAARSDVAETIDELTFVDGDFAARVEAVERDLIDDYSRRALDAESHRRFESHYLNSARRREKVAFGEYFGQFVASAVPQVDHPIRAEPVEETKQGWFGSWWKFAIPAFAAAILVAVAVPLWLNSSATQQANINAGTNSNQMARVQPTVVPSPSVEPTASPSAATTPVNQAVPPANESRRVDPPAPRVFALSLSPQLRGSQGEMRISIPAGADTVAVTLELEPTEFTLVRVELLERASGRVVWQGRSRPSVSGAYQTVRFSVQRRSLRRGSFNFTVSGVGANGEIIGTYPFVVVP